MSTSVKIDFVSDVSCPWCVIGLRALDQALQRLESEVTADIHFQPFELNPNLAPGGEDFLEYMTKKRGVDPVQMQRSREHLRSRGEALGFVFNFEKRTRVYNTFDAHRLLHWAELEGRQQALKEALFKAYFTDGRDMSCHATLLDVVEQVGLDAVRASKILQSDEYAAEVRERETRYQELGIRAVPSLIINDRYLIEGGQPVEAFERALRQIAMESRTAATLQSNANGG